MKMTTCGKSHGNNWYGLNYVTYIPKTWKVTLETLSWEVWKITITTSTGYTKSKVLKKNGNQPRVVIKKKLFIKDYFTTSATDLDVEDYEEK